MVEETGIRFELTVDGEKQLDRALSRGGDHLSDVSPFFEVAADMIAGFVELQFDTQGGRTGGWAPLSPQYAAWKFAQVGAQPIMVFTGRLKRSLVERGANNIREISPDRMRWGTSIKTAKDAPYPIFHQRGGRGERPPQRRIIDLTENDRNALMKALQRFILGDPEEFGLEIPR